ncbi:hypothetical protein OAU13_00980 [bacterium]|nr:hypothetical protein [bacterium]
MPAVARKKDEVQSPTGTGVLCGSPVKTAVGEVNDVYVFANNKLIPVKGNKVEPHSLKGCSTDNSVLDKFSPNVFIGNKEIGRVGDEYATGTPEANIITKGSPNVFANG